MRALFAAIVRAMPAELRARHGAAMLRDSSRLVGDTRARRGRLASAALALRVAADLVRVAFEERSSDRRPLAHTAPRKQISHRRSPMFDGLSQDLRDALRALRRSPAHSLAVIATLALGIGANAAIFSVVHSVLLKPLPYRAPERLVLLWEKNPERNWTAVQAAPANLLDWGERVKSFEATAGFTDWLEGQTLSAPGEPTPVSTQKVMGDLFGVLGAPALHGRTFTAAETWAGTEPVAVLSHRLWRERFGGDPAVVGRRIEIDREPVTVIGVMPESFSIWSREADLWRPFGWSPEQKTRVSFRRAHYVRGVARLAPGASHEAARLELERVATDLEREYPDTNRAMGAGLTPLRTWLTGDLRRPLLVLALAVALVLLVACANVTHLQLARALASEHDLALRGCLGASSWRMARRGLVESAFLSSIGALAGFALAFAAVPSIVKLGGGELARQGEVSFGAAVAGFAALLAVAAAAISGTVPALQARTSRLERALRESTRSVGEGRRRRGLRQLLVALEAALAVTLVAGALLLARSRVALERVEPGIDPRGVVTASIALPPLAYPDSAAIGAFEKRLTQRLEAIPGVESVGLANNLPLTEESWSSDFSVEGRAEELYGIDVLHKEASPGYFEALGVPLRAGRMFTESDDANAPAVVLINETLARRYFAKVDPIGLRICNDHPPEAGSTWRTIVGVVGDQRQATLAREVRPEIYAPMAQDPNSGPKLVVRSSLPPETLVPAMRAAIAALDPRLPLYDVRAMDAIVADSLAKERFLLRLFGGFAGLALALAAVGVYGVAAQGAAARRREVGVRLALGALPRQAVTLLVSKGALAVGVGAFVGIGGALALGRAMAGLLFATSPFDPAALFTAPLLLVAIAVLASWLPARRAARVHPAEVLRAE